MVPGSELWHGAITYNFDFGRSYTGIESAGLSRIATDEFKDAVRSCAGRLGVRDLGMIDSDYYTICTVPPVASHGVQLHLTQEPTEVEIAREMGHLALGQDVDPCFAMAIFEGPGNQDSHQERRFIRETTISQWVSDLFVNDIISQFKDEFVVDLAAAHMGLLKEIAESWDVWTDPEDLEISALYQRISLATAALERMGSFDWQTGERPLNKITSDIHWSLGDEGVGKVDNLLALYRSVPDLPRDIKEAVRMFEGITRKAARILEHTVPVLEYSNVNKWHYWTKVEKLALTDSEKHGLL